LTKKSLVFPTGGVDVLYNKFDVDSDNPPQPDTDYSCVVAAVDQWTISRCSQPQPVVCQSIRQGMLFNKLFTVLIRSRHEIIAASYESKTCMVYYHLVTWRSW